MDASNHRRNVEQVFGDFQGRRAGIIKALTTDVDEFYAQCDPEKENLCLYARPNEQWEVMLPTDEMPAELPEPVIGINFAREGLEQSEWVKLVAVHSDAWLVGVAFYTAAKAALDKADRNRLFNMVNDLPTVCEVVTGAHKAKASVSNRSTGKSKSNSKSGKSSKSRTNDEEEGFDEEDDEEALCSACGESYASDEFWICCDVCDKWFHGNCVKVTAARAEHIKRYKCPLCTNKRARR